jgi:putative transposase
MLKVQLSIPEMKAQMQAIQEMALDPVATLSSLVEDLRSGFEQWLSDLMQAELALHLGRGPYERRPGSANYRNGYRSRQFTLKGLGTLQLRIPRDRDGGFRTRMVPERIQYDPRIEQDLQMLFLGGASTRTVELMSERLFGRRLSAGEVSAANKKLLEPVEAWRNTCICSWTEPTSRCAEAAR